MATRQEELQKQAKLKELYDKIRGQKAIRTSWFPFGDYIIFNFFELLFYKGDYPRFSYLRHEYTHTVQMRELGYIFFYIWYGLEYIIIRFFHKKQADAYLDVSFEEEARASEADPMYLATRKPYSWLRFIKVRSADK